MSKKNYEKPQKGNPHGLTIDQHVFPKRSIERFAGQDGRVYVYLKSKQVYFQAAPGDVIFCAKRIWDQRAEYGYMREIEDKFQALAESIICGDLKEIDQQNTEILNDFLVLWHLRVQYRNKPLADAKLNGIAVDTTIYKDRQERLEKLHIGCLSSDGMVPGRDIAGMQIQLRLIAAREQPQLKEVKWGIIKAQMREFIVPDIFLKAAKTVYILPLSPSYCLISPNQNVEVPEETVREINRLAVEYSQDYYFARDFSQCPL